MLISLAELKTYRIVAAGVDIGRVLDIVFPRGQWTVRYIVVWSDTLDRQIAFPASHIGQVDDRKRELAVDAQPDLVEASPRLDLSRQIERHEEEQLYEHYGWPPYWLQEEHDVTPIGSLSGESEELDVGDQPESGHPEVQLGTRFIEAYTVHANEGEFGALEDIVIDDARWTIPYLAVEAPSREGTVLVETGRIGRVDWITEDIYVLLPAATILEGPAIVRPNR